MATPRRRTRSGPSTSTRATEETLAAALRPVVGGAHPGAYVAFQAFIAPSGRADAALERMRTLIRDRTGWATTAGYGPRFLHSTGQLHKGGAPSGRFLQLTSAHPRDREIPGWPYTFGGLIDAQADGDAAAIASHDLPILRLRLGGDQAAGLRQTRALPRDGARGLTS